VLKRFDFSSVLQRMTSIVEIHSEEILSNQNLIVFTKGSPEKVLDLCNPKSIPMSFSDELLKFTS